MRSLFHTFRAVFLFLLLGQTGLSDDSASWAIKQAPYRATLRMTSSSIDPGAGVLIEIPDFGVHRQDLGDVVLLDTKGQQVPLVSVWHAVGERALFLAKSMNPGEDYFLYFGGKYALSGSSWQPRMGLQLETRALGAVPRMNTEADMMAIWNGATKVDGIGFVNSINTTGNPFGESTNFASHYTGWLKAPEGTELTLYTLSSDASFVLADGKKIAEWPGVHGPRANEKNIHKGTVTSLSDVIRIDYYQAKVSDGVAFAALGWQNGKSFAAVPTEAWIHPGKSGIQKLEQASGLPVPCPAVSFDSYMGYGGYWLYDASFVAHRSNSPDWMPEWHFSDGTVISGERCERLIPAGSPQSVTLLYRKGNDVIRGVRQILFPENLSSASAKNWNDLSHYLGLLWAEKPEVLPATSIEPFFPLLFEYANNDLTGKFSTSWLQKSPSAASPFWIDATLSSIRSLAQTDPRRALLQLRGIDPSHRKEHQKELSLLELDLLVFYLRDPSVENVVRQVKADLSGTEGAELALIRLGDYYRMTDQSQKAELQYRAIQKTVPDETGGRKLPAMDRSYSIAVDNLLATEMRHEADQKLREWEIIHPMAKIESDFLLLQARMLNSFGYWSQALAELDSFKNAHKESPYEITADFYRAEAMEGLGRHDDARTIRRSILANYPKHELAEKCRELLSKE